MLRWFENRIDPFPSGTNPPPPSTLLAFIAAGTSGMRGYILGMVALTAVVGAFEAALFSVLGHIVDWLSTVPRDRIWSREGYKLAMLLAVLLGSILLTALQSLIKHQILAGHFPMRLRWNFHRHLLNQSIAFYQDEFAGRIATKVMQTSLAVRDVVLMVGDILVFVSIYFLTVVWVVGSFHGVMLVPLLAWFVLYATSLYFFVPRLSRAGKFQADARSLMVGRITDAYTNIMTVKLFSHTRREADYVQSAMRDFLDSIYKQMRLVTGFQVVNHGLSMGLIAATGGTSLWLWSQDLVGIGAVAAATAMAMRLNGISHWIMWEMASLFENVGTVQDGLQTLSRAPAIIDAPDAGTLTVRTGDIRFENVCFSYNGSAAVIDNLSLHIKPGEKIGLVGRSGAGKSTIINLLLRFYDLHQGRILIDGQDIAEVTQDSLRSQIGMVTQDTSLLHRSVRDNIVYGRPEADDAAMIAAARRAEAHEFITALTDPQGRSGYHAQVGERGIKLSGGQRQRIAIARVMLKDAPVLLLDEATSALDSEVEQAIQASLYRLMEGKTVVAIAHRLSTIAAMDRLLVIDHGRIVEEGNHHSLLARDGLYARLWTHQSGGFIAADYADASEGGIAAERYHR